MKGLYNYILYKAAYIYLIVGCHVYMMNNIKSIATINFKDFDIVTYMTPIVISIITIIIIIVLYLFDNLIFYYLTKFTEIITIESTNVNSFTFKTTEGITYKVKDVQLLFNIANLKIGSKIKIYGYGYHVKWISKPIVEKIQYV